MKRFDTGEGPRLARCPYCNEKLDRSEGVTPYNPESRLPGPGDVSVCIECGEPAVFDADMNMVKLSESKRAELMKDEHVAKTSFAIKAMRAANDPSMRDQFNKQLDQMAVDVKKWKADHPDSQPMIQYNYQADVGLIATFKSAVENKFVMLNEDATAMVTELGWMNECRTMPTVNMVRAVLSHVFGEE